MMGQEKTRKRHWHTIYRLVLRKDETLEEIGSYRLTLLNLYVLLSSIILVTMSLMVIVIFFTPLKRLVPGYAMPSQHPDFIRLSKKVSTLEQELSDYKLYYEQFNRMIRLPDSIEPPVVTQSPKVETLPVEKPGTNEKKQEEEPKSVKTIKVSNPPSPSVLNVADYRYLMPPISGVVSSKFDPEADHFGVDILAPHDTPVKAIWDGHVIIADWTLETGYTLGIQHNNDMVSFYKHNAVLLKQNGAFVRAGEAVAIIGNTGKLSSGPHLHFELWIQGRPVDPTDYIDF
jgi:murein DD-endopeptidase MepM/ murein hydrolase activator NlpD